MKQCNNFRRGLAPRSSKSEVGFSLIEIMVVVTIAGIMIAAGVASYTQFLKSSRDATRKSDIAKLQGALEQYNSANGSYPAGDNATGLNKLKPDFIDKIPEDPKTGPYTYRPEPTGCNETPTACTTYTLQATLEVSGLIAYNPYGDGAPIIAPTQAPTSTPVPPTSTPIPPIAIPIPPTATPIPLPRRIEGETFIEKTGNGCASGFCTDDPGDVWAWNNHSSRLMIQWLTVTLDSYAAPYNYSRLVFRLRADRHPCPGGYPRVIVRINGWPASEFDVTSPSYADYTVPYAIASGVSHSYSIQFKEDSWSGSGYSDCEDRNVHFDYMELRP